MSTSQSRTTTENREISSPIIGSFLKHNLAQSTFFSSPGQHLLRAQYRAKYPTEIAVLKCMDGRLNFAVITETPFGLVQPFRNLGGKFDIGSHFGRMLAGWVDHAVKAGHNCIIFVTYHFSKGDPHRGCKGFDCNKEKAMEYTKQLVKNIEAVFGTDHAVVYPILVGIETDEDALTLHSPKGEDTLALRDVPTDIPPEAVRSAIRQLYPDMNERMIDILLEHCTGNIRHIAKTQKLNRPITDIDHKEMILAVGRGFDWYHLVNKMLIVGPYDYDLAKPIATAGKILLNNIVTGSISKEQGVALISSAVFEEESGPEAEFAKFKAESLARFAFDTLVRDVPELIPYLKIAGGVLNKNNRLFTPIRLSDDLGEKLIEQQQQLLSLGKK